MCGQSPSEGSAEASHCVWLLWRLFFYNIFCSVVLKALLAERDEQRLAQWSVSWWLPAERDGLLCGEGEGCYAPGQSLQEASLKQTVSFLWGEFLNGCPLHQSPQLNEAAEQPGTRLVRSWGQKPEWLLTTNNPFWVPQCHIKAWFLADALMWNTGKPVLKHLAGGTLVMKKKSLGSMNEETAGQRMYSGSCSQVLLRPWMTVRRKQTKSKNNKGRKRRPTVKGRRCSEYWGASRPTRARQDHRLWLHKENRWVIETSAFNLLFLLISSLSNNPKIPLDVKRRFIMTLKFAKVPVLRLQP